MIHGVTRPPKPWEGGSRAEFVYRALRDGIAEGHFRPGERILEEEVARSLGVSRTPVREALRRLEARGLVEMAAGRGLVVVELTGQRIAELYAVREVLEGTAARFAAQHASEADIDALRSLVDQLRDVQEHQRAAKINRAFHRAIYEAARNRYLLQPLNELHDAMALLPGTTYSAIGRLESSREEHMKIVGAIAARDADAAEQAARAHIRTAQRLRLEMIARIR